MDGRGEGGRGGRRKSDLCVPTELDLGPGSGILGLTPTVLGLGHPGEREPVRTARDGDRDNARVNHALRARARTKRKGRTFGSLCDLRHCEELSAKNNSLYNRG